MSRRRWLGAGTLALGCAALLAVRGLAAQEGRPQVERQGTQSAPSVPDEMQPDTLPTMPRGMSLQMIVAGDSIFHGKGGCFACHGAEAQGEPAAGDAISVALNYAMPQWQSIDSLVTMGIPDALTRSPIAMPPRGARSDLTDDEIQRVAAYVWAISQTHGEPWPGGHTNHTGMVPPGAGAGTATVLPGEKKPEAPPAAQTLPGARSPEYPGPQTRNPQARGAYP